MPAARGLERNFLQVEVGKYGGLEVSDAIWFRLKALEDAEPPPEATVGRLAVGQRGAQDTLLGKNVWKACGAASSSDSGNGASRAESAARVRAGGTGSFDSALPVQTTG